MNILLLASHAVAEFDDVRMFSDLGYDVFCPGGYEVPSRSGEGIRPALPDAPYHPEFVARCEEQRAKYGEPGEYIDWAKARLHDDLIDWADTIIVHHFPRVWIGKQWERIKHKRVIWRTCGQSDFGTEQYMAGFRPDLQIVRYSPAEERFFRPRGAFAGQDALIRFGKYPGDYGPWTGDWTVYSNDLGPVIGHTGQGMPYVGNVTQDLVERGDACGYGFWQKATEGLPAVPAGKGSDVIKGLGTLTYDEMLRYLAGTRAYLYTGTRPASYTLGLIEAMLSGVPVISISAKEWGESWGGEQLFEADEIAGIVPDARVALTLLLDDYDLAYELGHKQRQDAIGLFGVEQIGAHWRAFLS